MAKKKKKPSFLRKIWRRLPLPLKIVVVFVDLFFVAIIVISVYRGISSLNREQIPETYPTPTPEPTSVPTYQYNPVPLATMVPWQDVDDEHALISNCAITQHPDPNQNQTDAFIWCEVWPQDLSVALSDIDFSYPCEQEGGGFLCNIKELKFSRAFSCNTTVTLAGDRKIYLELSECMPPQDLPGQPDPVLIAGTY